VCVPAFLREAAKCSARHNRIRLDPVAISVVRQFSNTVLQATGRHLQQTFVSGSNRLRLSSLLRNSCHVPEPLVIQTLPSRHILLHKQTIHRPSNTYIDASSPNPTHHALRPPHRRLQTWPPVPLAVYSTSNASSYLPSHESCIGSSTPDCRPATPAQATEVRRRPGCVTLLIDGCRCSTVRGWMEVAGSQMARVL